MFLKMHFFRDAMCRSLFIIQGIFVRLVLRLSCIIHTLKSSALASCVALHRSLFQTRLYRLHPCNRLATMQLCARGFLNLAKKSLFLKAPLALAGI